MSAFLFIANKRKQRERKEALWVSTMGSRGEKKEVEKALKDE